MRTPKSPIFLCAFLLTLLERFGVIANQNCIRLSFSVSQKVDHLGFHRDANWLIEAPNLDNEAWMNASCDLSLMLEIPKGMYVNPDQIDDLKRLKKLDGLINDTVDIEAIAHEASPHAVYIFLNSSELEQNISVKLPVHLRYHRSLLGGFEKVALNKPKLLVYCQQSNSLVCGKGEKVIAPVNSNSMDIRREWKSLKYKAHFDETIFEVPIGDLDDYSYVSVITCLLGCVGCVYILRLLSSDYQKDD